MLWQEWWVWMGGAILLGILEMLAPAYVLLGFASGAAVVSLLLAFGLLGTSFPAVLLIYAIASVVSFLLLRRSLGVRKGQITHWDRDINE